jgi:hypothetical protein
MYTLENLQTLKEAIATGAKEVWYGNKRVQYRSLDEMIRIKNDMEKELGLKKGATFHNSSFCKGL